VLAAGDLGRGLNFFGIYTLNVDGNTVAKRDKTLPKDMGKKRRIPHNQPIKNYPNK